MIIFIFPLSWPIPTYYSLIWNHNGILKFSEFYCYFFRIFYYATSRNETERSLLFSLFLGLFQPILALNEATMVFFDFFKFFPIFLKFSIMRQVGTEWNRTTIFIFSLFRPIPTYYGLKWNHNCILKFSEFYCYFFRIFYYATGKNETER